MITKLPDETPAHHHAVKLAITNRHIMANARNALVAVGPAVAAFLLTAEVAKATADEQAAS